MEALVLIAGLGLVAGIAVGWALVAGSAVELFREW